MKTLVLFAHPGQQHSTANALMAKAARSVEAVTFVDLYAQYPRHEITVEQEQKRLLDHDAVVFQFPLFWYSTPSLLKEWQDLVLEYGFAYGADGNSLRGKIWLNAVTAGAPETAYSRDGHNHFTLPELLSPLQATANLCGMRYAAPYTLFSALSLAGSAEMDAHVAGYKTLLETLCTDRFDLDSATGRALIFAKDLPGLTTGDPS